MPADPHPPIAGVLLAAGLSSRMGRNKMLLPLEGESVLRRAARRALAAGLAPLVVVLGHEAERAAGELAGIPCRTVRNPDYARGITTSLRAGVAAVPAEAAGAVVMLADMPFVSADMIAGLVARHRATGAALVISDYAGVNAPPMLYDRSLFAEILATAGAGSAAAAGTSESVPSEGCGRQVVKRHRHEAEVLCWPPAALADLDLPEDYERLHGASGDGAAAAHGGGEEPAAT